MTAASSGRRRQRARGRARTPPGGTWNAAGNSAGTRPGSPADGVGHDPVGVGPQRRARPLGQRPSVRRRAHTLRKPATSVDRSSVVPERDRGEDRQLHRAHHPGEVPRARTTSRSKPSRSRVDPGEVLRVPEQRRRPDEAVRAALVEPDPVRDGDARARSRRIGTGSVTRAAGRRSRSSPSSAIELEPLERHRARARGRAGPRTTAGRRTRRAPRAAARPRPRRRAARRPAGGARPP